MTCRTRVRYQKHSYSRPPGEHHRHISPSKRCHNTLGQRLFKTEPLYSPTQGDETNPGFFQSLLNFFAQLWSPATTNPEKLGYAYIYGAPGTPTADTLLGEYGSGGANSAGSAIHVYLPTPNGPMPMAAFINGARHAVHADHLNTPRKLTRANSGVAWQWPYSAFGDAPPTLAADRYVNPSTTPNAGTTSIPRIEFNLRYPGQLFDKESNLHYNYQRTYQPGSGRYTQADPIGLEGGWNRFAYVEGNPLSYTDPEGLRGTAAGGARVVAPTTMYRQMTLPGMPSPGPGPQPIPTLSPSMSNPFSGRQEGMRLVADSIGNIDFRTPSNVNWGNPIPGPVVPPGCTVISSPPSANMCSANSMPTVVCGPVVGPRR